MERRLGSIPMGNLYLGGRSAADEDRSQLSDQYLKDLRTPGSFTAGLLEMQKHSVGMRVAAGAGDLERARMHYQAQRDFYAANQDNLSRAFAMNPGRDPFLMSIWNAARAGVEREYDGIELAVPGGRATAGDLFGDGDGYKRLQAQQLTAANFSDPVVKLLTAGPADGEKENPATAELRGIVGGIVNPIIGESARTGTPRLPNVGQYAALADYVATSGALDVEEVGADAVKAVVTSIMSEHMLDGTAITMYDWALDALAARKAAAQAAGVKFVPSREAYSLMNSYKGLAQSMTSEGRQAPDNVSRWNAMTVASLVAANPDVDLDDLGVRQGIMEMSDVLASAERSGVKLLPLVQGYGGKVKQAIAGYVTSRAQGLAAPEVNLMTRLGDLHRSASMLIAPGWNAVSGSELRADPTKARGKASGVFHATSGTEGLDNAGVALYRSLIRGGVRGVVDGSSAREAILSSLSRGDVREDMALELSGAMNIAPTAARGIVDEFVASLRVTGPGSLSQVGLERAIAGYAFKPTTITDRDSAPYRKQAAKWYAANVGETGRAYDDAIAASGWVNNILRDPVLGFGDHAPSKLTAIEANLKQQVRADMQAAAEAGRSPELALSKWTGQGRYYYVSGFQTADGDIVSPDEVRYTETGRGRLVDDAMLTPVIAEGFGTLREVNQPWTFRGQYGRLPVFGPGMFSANPGLFRAHQAALKQVYDAQQKGLSKVASQPPTQEESW